MSGERLLHYEIVRPLGRGGMGEVVEAIDSILGRHVALKFIAAEMASNPDHVRRFEREARSAAGLSHPHIATVYAFERAGDRPFIAMELLSGRTLRDLLRDGTLPRAQAMRTARDTLAALAFAHARGIVHRDVKPENLMFDQHGAAKLTDFGLAHAANESRLTMTGTTLGTAAYIAPEAMRGQADFKSDVFAAGVMLHEMLAGELPFSGDAPLALMYAIATLPPRPLRDRVPDAPEALVALLARLLEKSPEQRIDAAAAAHALDVLLGNAPAAPSVDESGQTQPLPTLRARTEELEVERVERPLPVQMESRLPARRTGWPASRVIVFAFMLLAALAAGAWVLMQGVGGANRQQARRLNDSGYAAMTERQDLAAARHDLETAVKLDPSLGEAQLNLALVDHAEKRTTEAAQRIADVVRRHRGANEAKLRAWGHSHLADFAVEDGNWADAVSEQRASFAEDSSDARAYNQLGWVLTQSGAAGEAAGVLRRGIARFAGVAALHKNLALALARLDRPDEARASWAAFLRLPHAAADSSAAAAELQRFGVLR